MKVLVVHNYYLKPGGEDQVFAAEAGLLERRGHAVVRHTVHNDALAGRSALALARDTIWSRTAYREVGALLRRERPDVMHVHNTLPLLSPSVYYAARDAGVPVVQTLHNFRPVCPRGLLYRDGAMCDVCVGARVPIRSVVHGCYNGSRAATAAIAAMAAVHNAMQTWRDAVDVFLVPSPFVRETFVQGGFPPERLLVKPHFVDPDPGVGAHRGDYALFAGRLSADKGVDTLVAAWRRLGAGARLVLVGEGPLAEPLRADAGRGAAVEFAGARSRESLFALMRDARFLVFPSRVHETFGLVIAEAYATGMPVVASRLGSAETLVCDGTTGRHVRPDDVEDLAEKLAWMWAHPDAVRAMGANARARYEREFTAARNYELLLDAYARAAARGGAAA